MKDGVQKIFREHVHTVETQTGLTLPPLVKIYVAELLAYYIDKPDEIAPELGYTIRVNEIQDSFTAKHLGDELLWVTGVFGQHRKRYGIPIDYFHQLGASAYRRTHSEVLHIIADGFPIVSNFVSKATRDCLPELDL
jgi:hypothetical protein